MQYMSFTDTTWQQVSTSATYFLAQASGQGIEVFVGAAPPAASDAGFDIPTGQPVDIPYIGALGGHVFLRSTTGRGAARYAVA